MKKWEQKSGEGRLSIRWARPEDMEAVRTLERRSLMDTWDMHPFTDGPIDEAEARKYEESPERDEGSAFDRVLAAIFSGSVVGMLRYRVENEPEFPFPLVEIRSLCIDPGFRRRGVASRLLAQMKTRTAKIGVKALRLSVQHENHGARNLFRAAGFFDESHRMLVRLEPTRPEKAKREARLRKGHKQGDIE